MQCRQVIVDRQAYAVIPPRKNAKPWKDTKVSTLEQNELLRIIKGFGRTIWKNGQAIIAEVWSKSKCIALNY